MSEFKRFRNAKVKHRRIEIVEFRPWEPNDQAAFGGGAGDMIARNPNHHAQQWLVSASEFAATYEDVP